MTCSAARFCKPSLPSERSTSKENEGITTRVNWSIFSTQESYFRDGRHDALVVKPLSSNVGDPTIARHLNNTSDLKTDNLVATIGDACRCGITSWHDWPGLGILRLGEMCNMATELSRFVTTKVTK